MANSNMFTRPASIEVSNSEQILEVEWADGHRSVYPLFGLRKNCPCVACRGGHSEMGQFEMKLFFMDPPERVEVLDLETVGNHALRISWSDGHNTGMYRWDLLRTMCPQSWNSEEENGDSDIGKDSGER